MPWLDLWTGGVESTSLWNGRNISSSASQLLMPSSPSLPWYVVNHALIWPNRCVYRLLSSLSSSGIIASDFESIRCGTWRWSGPWRSWLHGKIILVIFGSQFLLLKLKKKRSGPLDSVLFYLPLQSFWRDKIGNLYLDAIENSNFDWNYDVISAAVQLVKYLNKALMCENPV